MNKSLLSRLAATFLLSIPFGYFSWSSEQNKLRMLQVNASDYDSYMKHTYDHSVLFSIIVVFISLAIFVVCMEGIAWLIRCEWKKKSGAHLS